MSGQAARLGFTLAEVLITLGIIGVVAAMTMPVLYANHQKKVIVTQLKKAYSILQQAIVFSTQENGSVDMWALNNISGLRLWEDYFEKYIQYSEVGSMPTIIAKGNYTRLNGSGANGDGMFSNYSNRYVKINDGMILIFSSGHVNSNNAYMGVDVNGLKRPNRLGKDVFYFVISNKYGLQPYGGPGAPEWNAKKFNRDYMKNNGNGACNKNSFGNYCTALIMNDGWEIKNDYPW